MCSATIRAALQRGLLRWLGDDQYKYEITDVGASVILN